MRFYRSVYEEPAGGVNAGDDQTKTRWRNIGVTFKNKDGSETILLDALPLSGKIVLREPSAPAKADTPETT